jgi:hypothetical protein
MPVRNTHRVGDHLIVDEESGHVVYRSQVLKIWDGSYRRLKSFETRQPQEFVRAKRDPKSLSDVRPDARSPSSGLMSDTVGDTSIATPVGAAHHIYDTAIGDMEIGHDFRVR